MPLIAAAAAVTFLHERPTVRLAQAGALVLGGLALALSAPHRRAEGRGLELGLNRQSVLVSTAVSMVQQLTEEQALALAKGPLSGELLRLAASTVEPLFWPVGPPDSAVLRNGTTFFVNAGQGIFGVTAGQVFDAYVAHKRDGGGRCHVGMQGVAFDLEARLIDRGRDLDIATYRIEPREIGRLGATIRHEPNWPPPPTATGHGVFYAGYPAAARKLVGERSIEWGVYGARGIATSVSDRSIACRMEPDHLIEALGLPRPDVGGHDTGGLGGAPLFALSASSLVYWQLAGVITDGGGVVSDHVRAAPADRIRIDGTIDG